MTQNNNLHSYNPSSSARIKRKYDIGRWEIFALKQQIEFLKIHYEENREEDKETVISFVQLQQVQKEINDFKRFLKIHQFEGLWIKYFEKYL